MTETRTHQAGDEIDLDGTLIILGSRKSKTGIRWTWMAPALDTVGEACHATPEAAIDHARRALGTRCACGAVATMTAATVRTCADCYDRHVD
jgi:hypothetical protein